MKAAALLIAAASALTVAGPRPIGSGVTALPGPLRPGEDAAAFAIASRTGARRLKASINGKDSARLARVDYRRRTVVAVFVKATPRSRIVIEGDVQPRLRVALFPEEGTRLAAVYRLYLVAKGLFSADRWRIPVDVRHVVAPPPAFAQETPDGIRSRMLVKGLRRAMLNGGPAAVRADGHSDDPSATVRRFDLEPNREPRWVVPDGIDAHPAVTLLSLHARVDSGRAGTGTVDYLVWFGLPNR